MDAIHPLVKMSAAVSSVHALEGFPLFLFPHYCRVEHCDFFFSNIILAFFFLLSTAISNLLVCCYVKHLLMRSPSLKSQLLEKNPREEVKSILLCYSLCSRFSFLRKSYLCFPREVTMTRYWPLKYTTVSRYSNFTEMLKVDSSP